MAPDDETPTRTLSYVQAILEEMNRFAQSPETFFQRWNSGDEPGMSSLYIPGRGAIPITAKAQGQFEALTRHAMKQVGGAAARYDQDAVVQAIKARFAQLIVNAGTVSTKDAEEMINNGIADAAGDHHQLTHFVPVTAVVHETPSEFKLGPVDFLLQRRFQELYGPELADVLHDRGVSQDLADGIHRFFGNYRWVAAVTVSPCSPKTSQMRARQAVQQALDAVKLMIGQARGRLIRTAYEPGHPAATGDLARASIGKFHISMSERLQDAVLDDGWHSVLAGTPIWKLLSALLEEQHSSWDPLVDPKQRFLDALAWYGDAVSEPDGQAQVLKFWTALERLVAFTNSDPVERRVAILVSVRMNQFPDNFKQFQKSYKYRCNIIHGDVAYHGYDEGKSQRIGSETRKALLGYLKLLDTLQRAGPLTKAVLLSKFKELEALSREEDRKASAAPKPTGNGQAR